MENKKKELEENKFIELIEEGRKIRLEYEKNCKYTKILTGKDMNF